MKYYLVCVSCGQKYRGDEIRYRCECGEILEVQRSDWNDLKKSVSKDFFDVRLGSQEFPYASGVWRYKELLPPIPDSSIVSKPEGNTNIYHCSPRRSRQAPPPRWLDASLRRQGLLRGVNRIREFVGVDNLYLKHEGENPTGSFKDRGMTVGVSVAKQLRVKAVACASTGNTSSSLASYAALAGLKCFVFPPRGKISIAKLSQSIAYGAINIQIDGDFDKAMKVVQDVCRDFNIYLLNSINPFRIEGQKTIAFELLQQLRWQTPDWIVLPGGNLGNTAAIGKGLLELRKLGIITRLPRVAVIQAKGANPFYRSYLSNFKKMFTVQAETVASAIRIGSPVSFLKAQKIIQETNGVVEEVSDQEILDAKAIVDASGIGCEPASAATVAGIKKLVAKKIIRRKDFVTGILTGHLLKDPDTTFLYTQEKLSGIKPQFINKVINLNVSDVSRYIKSFML